jgi:hypothetical protein
MRWRCTGTARNAGKKPGSNFPLHQKESRWSFDAAAFLLVETGNGGQPDE